MISPSENGGAKATGRGAGVGMPVRLLGGGGQEVSRLEFLPLGQPEVVAVVETDGAEVQLKEEVAALDGRLRSQAERRSSSGASRTCRRWRLSSAAARPGACARAAA